LEPFKRKLYPDVGSVRTLSASQGTFRELKGGKWQGVRMRRKIGGNLLGGTEVSGRYTENILFDKADEATFSRKEGKLKLLALRELYSQRKSSFNGRKEGPKNHRLREKEERGRGGLWETRGGDLGVVPKRD